MNKLNYMIAFCLFSMNGIYAQKAVTDPVRKVSQGAEKPQKEYVISGKITQTHSYCGGAAPSEEMLKACETPVPYKGKTLYVRVGNGNSLKQPILLKFAADAAGNFSFKLKPGVYSIIQPEQVKELDWKQLRAGDAVQVDQECVKAWWKKPYYVLNVKDKNIETLSFNFYHPCFVSSDVPCLQYVGPMPP